jgi:hypothetical protein
MRNLNLWEVSLNYFQIEPNDSVCYTRNESNLGELYTCSHNLIVSNLDLSGEIKWSKDLTNITRRSSKVANITYLSLLNTLCVGFENGEIITIAESGDICNLVGDCENGILVSL